MLRLENLRLQLIPSNKPSPQHDNSTVVGVCSCMLVCSYCASVWVTVMCVTVIHMSFYSDHVSYFISHLSPTGAVVVSTLDIAAFFFFLSRSRTIFPQKVIVLKLKVPEFESICYLTKSSNFSWSRKGIIC